MPRPDLCFLADVTNKFLFVGVVECVQQKLNAARSHGPPKPIV